MDGALFVQLRSIIVVVVGGGDQSSWPFDDNEEMDQDDRPGSRQPAANCRAKCLQTNWTRPKLCRGHIRTLNFRPDGP